MQHKALISSLRRIQALAACCSSSHDLFIFSSSGTTDLCPLLVLVLYLCYGGEGLHASKILRSMLGVPLALLQPYQAGLRWGPRQKTAHLSSRLGVGRDTNNATLWKVTGPETIMRKALRLSLMARGVINTVTHAQRPINRKTSK